MNPARTSRRLLGKTKLLVLGEKDRVWHQEVNHLIEHLSEGDLVVANRSATLPSSFRGKLQRTGAFVEVRLAAFQGPDVSDLSHWLAFAFGEGDWRVPTEDRKLPPELVRGDRILFGSDLSAQVLDCVKSRLLRIRFESPFLEQSLYRYGRPIQYSYLKEDLAVWDQQTLFSGPPISVEPPSASFPLTWELMLKLKRKGVVVASLLHGAGISSTGDAGLDALLPLAEWYSIPQTTSDAFLRAKARGSQVIALGTTVLRAMESAWDGTSLRQGSRLTQLKVRPGDRIQTATGMVTGMHEIGTSHMNILDSFCSTKHIREAYEQAKAHRYLGHEYGDIALLRCRRR